MGSRSGGRRSSPLHPDAIARQERRAKALALRVAGRGLREIGKELGVSYECIRKDLNAVLDDTKPSETERNRLRNLEAARLDRLASFAEQLLLRGMVHVQSQPSDAGFEQWVTVNGVPTNVGGTLSADHVRMVFTGIERLERISAARIKLYGLDKEPEQGLPMAPAGENGEEVLAQMQAIFTTPALAGRVIALRREARAVLDVPSHRVAP